MSSNSRKQLEAWIHGIEVSGVVLDIGGSQNPIRKRVQSFSPREYYILDLPVPHEEKEQAQFIGDIQDVQVLDQIHRKRKVFDGVSTEYVEDELLFDQVFCLEVSEYWYDPISALQNISKVMNEGGKLYISFHFIYPVHEPYGEDFLRYTHQGVLKLMSESGFEVVHCIDRVVMGGLERLNDFYRIEGMRKSKVYDRHHSVGCLVEARKIGDGVGIVRE